MAAGDVVAMVEMGGAGDQMDLGYQPMAVSSYKDRFATILKDTYDDKKTWWSAVEALRKKDIDFRAKVSCNHIPTCRRAANCRLAYTSTVTPVYAG